MLLINEIKINRHRVNIEKNSSYDRNFSIFYCDIH